MTFNIRRRLAASFFSRSLCCSVAEAPAPAVLALLTASIHQLLEEVRHPSR